MPTRLTTRCKVGVLALQGDFAEHIAAMADLDVIASEVRTVQQLADVDALIVPGGESTTMIKLIDLYGLRQPLLACAYAGKPIWGTCAGLILLAKQLIEDRPETLGLMDILVQRNAFGRQVNSFEIDLTVKGLEGGPFHAIFIRAPAVRKTSPNVQILASLNDGTIVAVQQGRLLATAFHPELTDDVRLHRHFVRLVEESVS